MATRELQSQLELGLGDLVGIARRRIWWFVIPSGIGVVCAAILALALPAEYAAEATVAVEPQVIPPELANSTISASTETRYDSLRLQVLSRDNMSAVMDEFKLYEGETAPREDLIDALRDRIRVEPLPPAIYDPRKEVELNSFLIAFQWHDARVAADVANRLTRDFISANLKDRASLAEGTTEFFQQELGKARAELTEVGRQITDYKENFQGELPEQLLLNRERLERTRMDVAVTESRLETARDQIRMIEQAIEEMRSASTSTQNDPSLRKKQLELQLAQQFAQGKTEKHPDVRLTKAEVVRLDEILSERGAGAAPAPSVDEMKLRNELRDYEVGSRVYASDVERLKADIADLEQRIENTPRRQAELESMVKTYENLQESIRAIQLKKVDADMGRTIELANKGERFRIVESAVPPTTPFKPNRPLWFIAGTLLGLLTGMGLLVAREVTDQTFNSIADLQASLGLPVLAAVPAVELPNDMARRRLWIWGASSAALIAMLLVGGTLLYFATRTTTSSRPAAAVIELGRAHV